MLYLNIVGCFFHVSFYASVSTATVILFFLFFVFLYWQVSFVLDVSTTSYQSDDKSA